MMEAKGWSECKQLPLHVAGLPVKHVGRAHGPFLRMPSVEAYYRKRLKL